VTAAQHGASSTSLAASGDSAIRTDVAPSVAPRLRHLLQVALDHRRVPVLPEDQQRAR